MTSLRSTLVVGLATILLAACGASATPSPTGGGGGGGGGASQAPGAGNNATQAPGGNNATQAPGGGGAIQHPAGWDKYGKVSYTISNGVNTQGELGFSPAGSAFSSSGGTTLSYFDEASSTIVSIRIDGSNLFAQYGDGKITFASDKCTTSNLNVQLTSAAGSFDCTGTGITDAGAIIQGTKMVGTFSAKAS